MVVYRSQLDSEVSRPETSGKPEIEVEKLLLAMMLGEAVTPEDTVMLAAVVDGAPVASAW